MTAPTVNSLLMWQVFHHIEDHPELWDQEKWRDPYGECGTTFCFAGWTVELNGAEWVRGSSMYRRFLMAVPDDPREQVVGLHPMGAPLQVVMVADRAQRLLGLDDDQAERLFQDTDTDLERLYAVVEEIAGPDPEASPRALVGVA